MIIDFHTHTFPEKIAERTIAALSSKAHIRAFTNSTAVQLSASMDKAGIDMSVVLPVATAPGQVEKLNTISGDCLERTESTGLFYLGAIHPDYANYREELARVREMGIPGIKIHPVYQGTDLDDIRFLRILYRAAELGLAVVTHSGLDVGYPGAQRCTPQMIRNVIREVGGLTMIAAHMGGWKNWDEVPELLADTGVYLDTSFSTGAMHPLDDGHYRPEELQMLDAEKFMSLVEAFGAERILFGTDRPWSDPAECLTFIRALPLAEKDKAAILGGNAERVLGLQL